MKFISDLSTTILTRFARLVLLISAGIIITRSLQPHGKGIYTSVLAFVDISVMFGALGIGKAAIYHIGQKSAPMSSIAQTVCGVAMLNGFVVAVLSLLLGILIQAQVLRDISSSALLIAAPLSFLGVLNSYFEGLIRGAEYIAKANLAIFFQGASFFAILIAAMLIIPLTPEAVLAIYLVSLTTTTIVYTAHFRIIGIQWPPAIDLRLFRQMIAYGLVYQLYAFLQLLHYKLDIFIIGYFLGASHVGIYASGVAVAEVISNIPLSITFVLVPWIANRTSSDAYFGTAQVCRFLVILTTPIAILIGTMAPVIIHALYGEVFMSSVAPLRMMLPGVVMNGMVLIITSYLIGRGKLWSLSAISASAVILNVMLNIFLVPLWGVTGAAAASTATYSSVCVLAMVIFVRERRLSALLLLPRIADFVLLASHLIKRPLLNGKRC